MQLYEQKKRSAFAGTAYFIWEMLAEKDACASETCICWYQRRSICSTNQASYI